MRRFRKLTLEQAKKKYGAGAEHYMAGVCKDCDCEIHHRGEKTCSCRWCKKNDATQQNN